MEPSSIESITEFVEESLEMLGGLEVMGSHQESFDVGGEGGCPGQEAIHFLRRHPRMEVMLESQLLKGTEGRSSIGPDGLLRDYGSLNHLQVIQGVGVVSDFHPRKAGIPTAVGADGDPDGEGRLLSTTPLTVSAATSKDGIIQFDEAGQLIAAIPMGHGRPDLVAHRPDGLVGRDAQKSLGFQHGDSMFVMAHEQDQPEPLSQGGPGLLEDGPRGQRDLVPAALALVQFSGAVSTDSGGTASGTPEAFGPAVALQIFPAGQLRREPALNPQHIIGLVHLSPPQHSRHHSTISAELIG